GNPHPDQPSQRPDRPHPARRGDSLKTLFKADSVESSDECTDLSITVSNDTVEISDAAERLRAAVSKFTDQIILVFDETDYLTPSSPTAPHWKSEFNKFWRNLRAVYQSCSAQNRNLSMLISGVSSKWFSEESIDAIENAALHFVPEEYLSPLPRGASVAMIRRLGKTAGLNFSDAVADNIAEICADMPFWIRKSCSYIHGKIDVGLRPFEPQKNLVDDYLKEFISSDGTAMSEVALTHLFRVYPELRVPALECEQSRTESISPTILRALQKYGIIGKGAKPAISGLMMRSGLASLREKIDFGQVANLSVTPPKEESAYGEWAEELATISRRRNIIERRLREMVSNFIRFSSMSSGGEGAKERILKCINKQRRSELESFNIDKIMGKLYWLEVMAVVKKEWAIFRKIFGDQAQLNEFASIVNDRPDAHAKDLDQFEIAMHRRAVSWFEEKLDKT
ncbi:hypothetical protein ACI2KH_15895, partial [Roseomonas mucosa]|uniref:hypothetical protein n=1 Tax=Roseomonas mucosa TaxID=207340 RepID=UPI00385037C4